MEHDAQCAKQDTDLAVAKAEVKSLGSSLESAIVRWQKLCDDFHEHNITFAVMQNDIAHIKTKVDAIDKALETDFAPKAEVKEVKGWILKGVGAILLSLLALAMGLLKKFGGLV